MVKTIQVIARISAPRGSPIARKMGLEGRERRKADRLEVYFAVPGVLSRTDAAMGRRRWVVER